MEAQPASTSALPVVSPDDLAELDVLVNQLWALAQALKSNQLATLTQRLRHIQLRVNGIKE